MSDGCFVPVAWILNVNALNWSGLGQNGARLLPCNDFDVVIIKITTALFQVLLTWSFLQYCNFPNLMSVVYVNPQKAISMAQAMAYVRYLREATIPGPGAGRHKEWVVSVKPSSSAKVQWCLQATVKEPCVRNFIVALCIEYALGATPFVVMSFVGYWAYGNGLAPNIIGNLSGPPWAITLAFLAAFLQIIISLQARLECRTTPPPALLVPSQT